MHHKCVCMSKLFYDIRSKSDDLYYCPNCIVAKQSEEIFQLRKQIKDLLVAPAGMKALEKGGRFRKRVIDDQEQTCLQ